MGLSRKKLKQPKSETLIAYKAFDADWKCRGFQYEVGKTYRHDGDLSLCESGFHACTVPFDCWNYYEHSTTFALVELGGALEAEDGGDSKRVGASIHIKARLTMPEWIKAQAAAVVELCKSAKGQIATGDGGHAAATGYGGHAAATGVRSHAAATGDGGHAAATGDWGHAAATGYGGHAAATGKHSIAASLGYAGTAQGAIGSWIVCACIADDGEVLSVQSARVDGKAIKADTPYRLVKDGNEFKWEEA